MLRAAMSLPVTRTATAVALTAFAALLTAADLHADQPRVVIRMYDTATGDTHARGAAMQTASTILLEAGVTVEWRDCSRTGADYPCRTVRGARDLAVRIMPAFVPRAKATAAATSQKTTPA